MTAAAAPRPALPLRLAGALALAAGAALLGACASLPSGDSADAPTAAPAALEVAAYDFDVVAPEPLRTLLRDYLDLARFQKAPQAEGITGAELDRLAAAAPSQARALLETEGYFNARVTVAPATGAEGRQVLRMTVDPGPRVMVTSVTIDSTGPLLDPAGRRDAGASRLDLLRRAWTLPPGRPFRQAAWNDAKNAALQQVRAEAYPAAMWRETRARVDATANTAALSLTLHSGPLHRFGAIRVEGLQRYDAESVRRLATFFPGDVYSERLLLDYQERLIKVGLFEGASVELEPEASADAESAERDGGPVPVVVRVKELTLQQATFGVGISANTGPRVSVEHVHRQLFGQPWIARTELELGGDLKSLASELASYPLENLYRNLVSGRIEQLRSADEQRNAWSARIGRAQDKERIERLYYAEIAHARVQSPTLTHDSEAVSLNYNWLRRDLDNVLLPTDGTTIVLHGGAGYGSGTERLSGSGAERSSRGPFARTYARLTGYRPLGGWFAIARLEAGQVFVDDPIGVPDTLLFRAGGDDSVRGYGYRTLGPEVNGSVASGRVLATASFEVARPISPRWPTVWGALFVDAGNAADRWSDLSPVLGYGVGVRWRSPVGALRLDLAYGHEEHRLRLHFSVGIAF